MMFILRIPGAVADNFKDSGGLTTQREKLDKFNAKFDNISATSLGSPRASANPENTSEQTARTNCRPQFGPEERPHDFTMTLLPAAKLAMADFENQKEHLRLQ